MIFESGDLVKLVNIEGWVPETYASRFLGEVGMVLSVDQYGLASELYIEVMFPGDLDSFFMYGRRLEKVDE